MHNEVTIIQRLDEIDSEQWNALGEADYPFTRHEFLLALEQQHCLLEYGWQPVYFLIKQDQKTLAAIACYIKSNSYGELVFDHNWADAYERSGLQYYPKLVSAIPYTPATGPRFLIHRDIQETEKQQALRNDLLRVIQQFCIANELSGWHLLFERESTTKDLLSEAPLLYRYDCQYHWHNDNYRDFDDFLSRLSSRKRKNIRRERQSVQQADIQIKQYYGDELSHQQWARVHQLYAGIFDRKYGTPTLSAEFFQSVGHQLKQRVLVVCAEKDDHIFAASLFFISDSTLFGRVWGCDEYHNHLHFECCYYQGIDYCIKHELQHFDPGAQGEHKISRGFLPTRTCSAHWMVNQDFHRMIKNYLKQEEAYINEFCRTQAEKSPYRKENQ